MRNGNKPLKILLITLAIIILVIALFYLVLMLTR